MYFCVFRFFLHLYFLEWLFHPVTSIEPPIVWDSKCEAIGCHTKRGKDPHAPKSTGFCVNCTRPLSPHDAATHLSLIKLGTQVEPFTLLSISGLELHRDYTPEKKGIQFSYKSALSDKLPGKVEKESCKRVKRGNNEYVELTYVLLVQLQYTRADLRRDLDQFMDVKVEPGLGIGKAEELLPGTDNTLEVRWNWIDHATKPFSDKGILRSFKGIFKPEDALETG